MQADVEELVDVLADSAVDYVRRQGYILQKLVAAAAAANIAAAAANRRSECG